MSEARTIRKRSSNLRSSTISHGSSKSLGSRRSSSIRRGRISSESKFPQDFNGCYCVRYTPDEETFVASFGSGGIQVRDSANGEVIGVIRKPEDNDLPIMAVRFLPNDGNTLFSAGISGKIYLSKRKALTCNEFAVEKNNEINSIDINITGDFLVSGGKDAALRIYDIHAKKLVSKLCKVNEDDDGNNFHKMRVFSIKCHPDNQDIFLSGGWDNSVKVWDARLKGGCVKSINGPHICGDAIDIKDNLLLTGSWTLNNSLQIFDLRDENLLETVKPINSQDSIEGEFYYTAKFYKGNTSGDIILVGGSGTGNMEVISRSEMKVKQRFRHKKTVLCIDSKSTGAVFSGMSSVIKLVELPSY